MEWRVATSSVASGAISPLVVRLAVSRPIQASVLMLTLGFAVLLFAYWHSVVPLFRLSKAANGIARRVRTPVPCLDRMDELGALARVLHEWQSAAERRDILIERAPIGICQADRHGLLVDANLAAQGMLGYPLAELAGRDIMGFVHPSELVQGARRRQEFRAGHADQDVMAAHFRRSDGTSLWCSVTVAPIDLRDGTPERYILILDDVTERHIEAEQAALIQRQLLPRTSPPLTGYQLAGACLPAQDVGGDLYGWGLTERGELDLTVADAMGKGLAASLVMARLWTALRAAPAENSPSELAAAADAAVTFQMDGAEPFVTMFQGRLDPATGILRYVDAGHGYALLLRADGTLTRLRGTSLPLGMGLGEAFTEGLVDLRPRDTLLVHSDGLVEIGDRTTDASSLIDVLLQAGDAAGTVRALVQGVAADRTDDVTVVVLRRLAGSS